MTRDDRFIGHLEDYLDSFDGDTPLPGHIRDAISAELPRTRQVRPRRGPARGLTIMTSAPSRAPWAIAAAVVVVAIVGGAWFLSDSRGDVGATAPSVTPTAATAPSPTASQAASPGGTPRLASAMVAPCREGGTPDCIAAGTYMLDMPLGSQRVIVDVPTGWFHWYPYADFQGLLLDSGPDALGGSGWGVAFMRVGDVFRDPCDTAAGTYPPDQADTVDELVTAMQAWPGFTVSSPEPTSVDDVDGQLVTVTSTATTATCAPQSIWQTPDGDFVDAYPMVDARGGGRAGTFRIAEVGGELLVIRTTEFGDSSPFEEDQGVAPDPDRHAADLVTLQGIVDSIRLEAEGS